MPLLARSKQDVLFACIWVMLAVDSDTVLRCSLFECLHVTVMFLIQDAVGS